MAVYEMLWDCGRCDTSGLLGQSHRHCPNCGAAQDPDARYFPSDGDKVAVKDHVYHGRDLVCAHCETPNSKAARHCVNCGAPMGDGDDVEVALVSEDAAPIASPGASLATSSTKPGDEPRQGSCLMRGLGLLALAAVVMVVGLLCVGLWTRDGEVELTDRTWERSVEIEEYARVSEESWCDRVPADAEGVSSTARQRSTEQVADGEDCSMVRTDLGDGTFQEEEVCTTRYRSEPVYDDWCSYTVERWKAVRTERASGGRNDVPTWPSTRVSNCQTLGCTREGKRRALYRLHLREVDGPITAVCEVSEVAWHEWSVGIRASATFGVIDGGLRCHSLVTP